MQSAFKGNLSLREQFLAISFNQESLIIPMSLPMFMLFAAPMLCTGLLPIAILLRK